MKRADINIFLAIIAAFALALVLNDPNRSATPYSVWEPVTLRNPVDSATQKPPNGLTSLRNLQPPSPSLAPPVAIVRPNHTPTDVRPVEYTARRMPVTAQPRYLPPSVIRNRQSQVPVHPSAQSVTQSSRVIPLPPVPVNDEHAVKAAVYRMGPDAPNAVRFANGWTEL